MLPKKKKKHCNIFSLFCISHISKLGCSRPFGRVGMSPYNLSQRPRYNIIILSLENFLDSYYWVSWSKRGLLASGLPSLVFINRQKKKIFLCLILTETRRSRKSADLPTGPVPSGRMTNAGMHLIDLSSFLYSAEIRAVQTLSRRRPSLRVLPRWLPLAARER